MAEQQVRDQRRWWIPLLIAGGVALLIVAVFAIGFVAFRTSRTSRVRSLPPTAAPTTAVPTTAAPTSAAPTTVARPTTAVPPTTVAQPSTTLAATSTSVKAEPAAAIGALADGAGNVLVTRLGNWQVVQASGGFSPQLANDALGLVVIAGDGRQTVVLGTAMPVDPAPDPQPLKHPGRVARAGSWLLMSQTGARVRAVNIDTGVRRELDVVETQAHGVGVQSAWSNHMIAISGDGTTLIDGNLNITRVSKAPMSSGDPLTVWTGTEQISFGIDNQGETNPIPFEPVVMIAATGARRAVPRPAWWQGPWPIPSPHQGGDPQFAATSGNDVLLTDGRPGGFAGLFNPATDTWRRVDSPPIPTNNAQLIDLPNELIVLRSFARTGEPGPEHAVRFDKTTGTWAELTLPSPVPVEQLLQGRDFTDRWLIGNFLGALAVLDKQTGALSTATSADQAAWKSYDSIQSAQLVARP